MFSGSQELSSPKPQSARIGTFIISSDPYWIQAMESIVHACQKLGDELILLQPAASDEAMRLIPPEELVDQILSFDLDALICNFAAIPLVLTLVTDGLPVVCLGELDVRHPHFTTVSSLFEGGRLAGEYIGKRLNGKGHVLCINAGQEKTLTTGQTRMAGFASALQPYPEISIEYIPAYWTYNQAYPALLTALKDYPRPVDAIFGVSDTLILAAREAGRKLGVIDKHTLLVGLNGDPAALAAIAEGELDATVDTASEYLGEQAVEVIHGLVQGLPQPEFIAHKFKLITQENVASLATHKLTAIADIPSHMVGYNRSRETDRMKQLEISMEITQQIGSLQESQHVIQVVSDLVREHYGYECLQIYRWSEENHRLVLYGGTPDPNLNSLPVEQDWLLNHSYRSKEVICIPDTSTSRRWQTGRDWGNIRSRALLPIQLGGEVIGVLDLYSSNPVRQPNLEIVGLKLLASQLGIVIQNTDLYQVALQARENAERANQLKNRLMANVGHEMRTPLNSILGFSQSIQKQISQKTALAPDELKKDVQHIYTSGEHLMYMINDLLDLSRAEIGALNLYFEQLYPVPFLRDLFSTFVGSLEPNPNVSWHLEIPNRLPVIRADTIRLRQVLINLLVNAQKFTPQGSVTLGAEVEPPYLHLWVRDTGSGVPFDLQEKIFEPFGISVRRRRPAGIGLGLSITRHLVALHDGTITLDSQPGQGSTFHVYLPMPGIASEPALTPKPGDAAIMLIVSTQTEIPEDLAKICQTQNLQPCLVAGVADIHKAFCAGKPALVAWNLANASPGEWRVIQHLSTDQNCGTLPILLFTEADQAGPNTAGLTNVVFKPCQMNSLKEWIGQFSSSEDNENPVLVVDDDAQAREYYQNILWNQQPQRRVLLAENGAQALEILKKQVPSLILLDLMMPEVDGFTVLEEVRNDPRTQHVPVIIISGKLLSYKDVQRLNTFKTTFLTKGILTDEETAELLRQTELEPRPLSQTTSGLTKQVLAFLHQNFSQSISRKDVADAVGVSENYLSQIFRQEISLSPWDYLNRLRIQKAKELLVQSEDSITVIASRVGFNDSAYFSRVFHKLTNQSPQEYRKSPAG